MSKTVLATRCGRAQSRVPRFAPTREIPNATRGPFGRAVLNQPQTEQMTEARVAAVALLAIVVASVSHHVDCIYGKQERCAGCQLTYLPIDPNLPVPRNAQ